MAKRYAPTNVNLIAVESSTLLEYQAAAIPCRIAYLNNDVKLSLEISCDVCFTLGYIDFMNGRGLRTSSSSQKTTVVFNCLECQVGS